MPSYSLAQAQDQLSRLVDEALAGEPVTITRDGAAVVSLTPSVASPQPITGEYLAEISRRRALGPRLASDAVSMIREMRDEEP